jgi:hypothetical protein
MTPSPKKPSRGYGDLKTHGGGTVDDVRDDSGDEHTISVNTDGELTIEDGLPSDDWTDETYV